MVKRESHSSDHLTGGSQRKIMTTKLATAIAAFFLLASIAVIIAIATVQVKQTTYHSPGLKYGIVLDAGSSRTTVYLYEWPAEKENNTGIVKQTTKCQVKGPGISDMDTDTWNSLKTCMEEIINVIPAHQHKSTALFLGATAGMRLLHQKNETQSNEVLRAMQNYLRSLPLDFHNASIISGQEEGLYGWITVNYLMGNFLEKNIWNAWVHPNGAQTVGSLDLGGASTQIAFTAPSHVTGPDIIKISLYGYEYNVYTHSFLCYGKNEAEKKVLAELVKLSSDWSRINHPCYPLGYTVAIPGEEIFGSECTKHSAPPRYTPESTFVFVGMSDPGRCKNVVKRIFDLRSCEGKQNCSFNGVYQPPVTGDFMAYAGFYYTAGTLDLKGSNSLEKFNHTVRLFCSLDWKTLKKQYNITDKHLKSYCYSANYVHTILADGYKFDANNWEKLDFQKEVNKTSIAWSLGYMLAQSNMIPAEAKLIRLPISNTVFVTLLFLFSALIIITLMFLIITLVLGAEMKLKVKRRYVVVLLSLLTLSVVMINTYSPLPCEQKGLIPLGSHPKQPAETDAKDPKHQHNNNDGGSWKLFKLKPLENHIQKMNQHQQRGSKLQENVTFLVESAKKKKEKRTFKQKQVFHNGRNEHSTQTFMAKSNKRLSNEPANGIDSKYTSHLHVPRHDQTIPQFSSMHSILTDIKPCRHKCTPDGPKPSGLKWKSSVGSSAEHEWASKVSKTFQRVGQLFEKKQHHSRAEINRVSGEGADAMDFMSSWCNTLHDQHISEEWDQTRAESLPWLSEDDVKKINLLARGTVVSKVRIPGHGQVLQVGLGGSNENTDPLTGGHSRLCQKGRCALIKRPTDWFEVLAFHLDRVLGLNRSLPAVLRTFYSDILPYKYTSGLSRTVVWWDPDIQHLADDDNDQNSFSLTWPEYQEMLKEKCGIQIPLNSSTCVGVHHSEWERLALFDFLLQVNDRLDRYCCGFRPDPADMCVENLLNVKCANPKELMLVHILVRRADPSRLVFIDNAGRPHHPQDNLNFRLIEGIDEFPERAMSVLRSGCLERLLLRSLSVDRELWKSQGGAAGLRTIIHTLQDRAQILLQYIKNKRLNTDL
ncbi:Ectonucleoside triphosphate diphosphohydrolase 3 [Bagarius yarrelli]|uniref:Ectonucleoside triphosphate diphosphohydrolase 3 n=1 Tax=Bagarius yarrelli TaxID=175774 RepID=A0A556TQ89_BAGYA|nr:Ectonucleoside triphosphate diphosphohydrolase 3 [Bagarius yarrelli]